MSMNAINENKFVVNLTDTIHKNNVALFFSQISTRKCCRCDGVRVDEGNKCVGTVRWMAGDECLWVMGDLARCARKVMRLRDETMTTSNDEIQTGPIPSQWL